MRWRWLAVLLPLVAFVLFWWGPDLRVQLGERGEAANLKRLGGAVALYMSDHDGQYPWVTGEEALGLRFENGVPVALANPLAPYVKDRSWLLSTGTRMPYALRFVLPLRDRIPRDPLVPLERRLRFDPDSRHVIATSDYADGWRRGWTRASLSLAEGRRALGHAYLLRSEGNVETVDLGATRIAEYDGATGTWSEPHAPIRHFDGLKPWSNPPWTIYPGEAWPPKVR